MIQSMDMSQEKQKASRYAKFHAFMSNSFQDIRQILIHSDVLRVFTKCHFCMPVTYRLSFTHSFNFCYPEHAWHRITELEYCPWLRIWNYRVPKMLKSLIFILFNQWSSVGGSVRSVITWEQNEITVLVLVHTAIFSSNQRIHYFTF